MKTSTKNKIVIFVMLLMMSLDTVKSSFAIKDHLKAFEGYRYPLGTHQTNWTSAKNYIRSNFEKCGLVVQNQKFRTKIATFDNAIVEVEGTNVIGTSLSSIENAPVVLIGANYDSTLQSNPLMENGASMAAILALASAFQSTKEKKEFVQNTTVVFVAFDVNVNAHVPMGPGDSGAVYFVRNFLPEMISEKTFLGAIILDSISNYNIERNSQILIEGFSETFHAVFEQLRATGNKGNFLGQMTRSSEVNMKFAHDFKQIYQTLAAEAPFHIVELLVQDGVPASPYLSNTVNQRAHLAFWSYSYPAFLLTDMGITRRLTEVNMCKPICNVETFWNDERKNFVEMTSQALLEMLMGYQTSRQSNTQQAEVPVSIADDHPDVSKEVPQIETPKSLTPSISTANISPRFEFHLCMIPVFISIFPYISFIFR